MSLTNLVCVHCMLRSLFLPMLVFGQDQYDIIDLSDNEIKKLDNFPKMKRLNALLINNNYVSRIAANIGEHLPSLSSLILTNNKVSLLSEIDHLSSLRQIENISLIDNPVSMKANYRLYVIQRLPSLKMLDFRKVCSYFHPPVLVHCKKKLQYVT